MEALDERMKQALLDFGFSESRIRSFHAESLVFHDLGVYGADFQDLHKYVSHRYSMTGRVPAELIVSEFSRAARWYWTWKYLPFRPFYGTAPKLMLRELESFVCETSS